MNLLDPAALDCLATLAEAGSVERAAPLAIRPEVTIDVALYWHQWKLGRGGEAAGATAPSRPGLVGQIGHALIAGARSALRPA